MTGDETMANAAERVYTLIKETVEQQGVTLWDVRFLKEGASHYLRIYIDKPEGINIDDCTEVSRAIDPIIDEADPIDIAYYLEVCSPGIERELIRDYHFKWAIGKEIKIKLYKAIDGMKEFKGILNEYADVLTLDTENGLKSFNIKEISKANLCDFE